MKTYQKRIQSAEKNEINKNPFWTKSKTRISLIKVGPLTRVSGFQTWIQISNMNPRSGGPKPGPIPSRAAQAGPSKTGATNSFGL